MAEETNMNVSQDAQNDSQATQNTQATDNKEVATKNTQTNQDSSELDIEKLIQKAVDRATNKLGNDNKKLRQQVTTLQKEKLSAEEIKQLELADKEADIADREAKLQERENRLFAIKAIKEAGLDDGSSNALELVDFVMSDDEEVTIAKVKTFNELVKKFVAAEVSRTFKQNGRTPEKGGNGSTTNNSNSVAVNIGKKMADRQSAATNVLNHYLGGKK